MEARRQPRRLQDICGETILKNLHNSSTIRVSYFTPGYAMAQFCDTSLSADIVAIKSLGISGALTTFLRGYRCEMRRRFIFDDLNATLNRFPDRPQYTPALLEEMTDRALDMDFLTSNFHIYGSERRMSMILDWPGPPLLDTVCDVS